MVQIVYLQIWDPQFKLTSVSETVVWLDLSHQKVIGVVQHSCSERLLRYIGYAYGPSEIHKKTLYGLKKAENWHLMLSAE